MQKKSLFKLAFQNETRSYIALFFLLSLFSFSSWSAEDVFFDEVTEPNGQVRAEYFTAEQLWNSQSEQQRKQFLVDSKKAFAGDNMLDSMPRIFTASEYDEVLKKGIHQRAAALQAFLRDYYSGENRFSKSGLMAATVLEKIVKRHSEENYKGVIRPDDISFIYGPDIIRDASGEFRVIEDNPGFIGGMGDLKLAQDYMLSQKPELLQQAKFRSASEFYRVLGQRYKQRGLNKGGISVIYMVPPFVDNEDQRIKQLFQEQGIEVVTPFTKKRLVTDETGVYLTHVDHPELKEKVGMVVLNGEHYWLDPSQSQNFEKLVTQTAKSLLTSFEDSLKTIEKIRQELRHLPPDQKKIKELAAELPYRAEMKSLREDLVTIRRQVVREQENILQLKAELQKSQVNYQALEGLIRKMGYGHWLSQSKYKARMAKDLTKHFLSGQVDINNSPGVDFIGDKELYVYVEDMIRFFLKQEPIIKNIRTGRFTTKAGKLSVREMKKIFGNLSNYVIKKVDGRGGDAVWVGPKIKAEDIDSLKRMIEAGHEEFIWQEFTPLSRLHKNIVDVRVITDIGPDSIFVTDTPWGRGLPSDGDGKVNISREGREITVLVENPGTKVRCEILFLR